MTAALAFSPDGESLAAINKQSAFLWDVRTGEEKQIFEAGDDAIRLAFSPDGATLATFGGKEAVLWDVQTGTVRRKLSRPGAAIKGLAFSPDGKTVATASETPRLFGELCFWDLPSGALAGVLFR